MKARTIGTALIGALIAATLAAPLASADQTPDTRGSVSGVVVDIKGKPVKGVWVLPTCDDEHGTILCGVADPELTGDLTKAFIKQFTTGPSAFGGVKTNKKGEFVLAGLTPGAYYVSLDNPFDKYVGKDVLATVTPGATTVIKRAKIKVGGTISGKFKTKKGKPVKNGIVSAFSSTTGGIGFSKSNGSYTIKGVAPGKHRVLFTRTLEEQAYFYKHTIDYKKAKKVKVTKGKTTKHIDIKF